MPEVPEDIFLQSLNMAVGANAEFVCPHDYEGFLYIRPLQLASSLRIGLELPDEYTFCVYVQPYNGLHSGWLKALILDIDRVPTRGCGKAKTGGNYTCVPKWALTARQEGYDLLLHLDSKTQTEIEEFSTSGFIAIQDDGSSTTLVSSNSDTVLDSITVDSVAALAKSFGWKVQRRPVRFIYFCYQ